MNLNNSAVQHVETMNIPLLRKPTGQLFVYVYVYVYVYVFVSIYPHVD
jgi:hypothetical protein